MEKKSFYACKAGIRGGVARCLNEEGHCGSHPVGGDWPKAARPDVVLFKVKLNENWRSRFATVRVDSRTWSERRELEAERAAIASKLGRDAYALRLEGKGDEHVPESADSGCPVFGRDTGGLKQVDVRGLIGELREAGFALADISIFAVPGAQRKDPFLVLAFAKGAEEASGFPRELVERLISTSFAFVHVWANPTNEGQTVHTVNCIGRSSEPNQHVLHYADGDWAAEPVHLATTTAV